MFTDYLTYVRLEFPYTTQKQVNLDFVSLILPREVLNVGTFSV